MAKVTMPQLGESVAEGTIGKWLKQPGDTVAKYEPLLEVITDKVNAEVPSPFEGVLKEILAEEGATVPNNAEIAIIETADEAGRRRTCSGVAREGGRYRPPRARPGRTPRCRRGRRFGAKGPAGSDETTPAAAPAAAGPARRRSAGCGCRGDRARRPVDGAGCRRIRGRGPGRADRLGPRRHRRSRRPDDPGRSPPAARARPAPRPDRRHGRRRSHHS